MSTRSYICMEVGDNRYKTIYCHFDVYLDYNGKMLTEYYNDRARVEKLLELGDLSILREKIDPAPDRRHGFDFNEQQKDVCVFYGRDRGDEGAAARIMTMEELDDPENWTEYVYIFNRDGEWKYFESGQSWKGLRDVREDLGLNQTEDQEPSGMTEIT